MIIISTIVLSVCVRACVRCSLQESILSQVQRIIKGEVSLAMKEQQAVVTSSIMQAMRSAAGTPVPTTHLDYQTQQANILQLLQQGQLNQAFQQVKGPPAALWRGGGAQQQRLCCRGRV